MEDKNPSMQEILSSIRRIIAEDNDDFGASPQRETRVEESHEPHESGGDGLLSAKAESEASESFGKLRGNIVAPREDEIGLNSLVGDLVRPLLREWLDAHLPEIIERLVREEIRRLAERGRSG